MKWSADQNWKTLSGWGPSHGIPKIHPISNVELHLSQGVPRCPKVPKGQGVPSEPLLSESWQNDSQYSRLEHEEKW